MSDHVQKTSTDDVAKLRLSSVLALKTSPGLSHRQLMIDVCDDLTAARAEIARLKGPTLIALGEIPIARMSDCPACKGIALNFACAVCHDIALERQAKQMGMEPAP